MSFVSKLGPRSLAEGSPVPALYYPGVSGGFGEQIQSGAEQRYASTCLTLPYVKAVPFYSFIYFVFVSLEWKVLKNRKFLGSLSTQDIRTKSKHVIEELHSQYVSVSELTTKIKQLGTLGEFISGLLGKRMKRKKMHLVLAETIT